MEEGARAPRRGRLRVPSPRSAPNRVQVRAPSPPLRARQRAPAREREGRVVFRPFSREAPDVSLTRAPSLALARALFHRARPRSSPRRRPTACSSRTRTSSRPTGTRRASCCPRRARRTTTAVGSGAAARGPLGPARSRARRAPPAALNAPPARAGVAASYAAARRTPCRWWEEARARARRASHRLVSARRPAARRAASARGAWPRTRPTASPPGCRRA